MTIQVDWSGTSSTPGGVAYEIYVPKADMTLIQAGPPTIYELDVDAFRLTLRDLEDDPDGRPWPKTHVHNTEVTLAGATYARTVQILAPYSVTFEDGQYRVLLAGANNNILDVANVNQVSIALQNSAGLIVVAGGAGDWTTGEKGQIRDALGVDGSKVAATGGQLQTVDGKADALLARLTLARAAALDLIPAVDDTVSLLKRIAVNRLELSDGAGDNWVLYADDDVTPLITWPVRDKGGGAIAQPVGAPSRRSRGTIIP